MYNNSAFFNIIFCGYIYKIKWFLQIYIFIGITRNMRMCAKYAAKKYELHVFYKQIDNIACKYIARLLHKLIVEEGADKGHARGTGRRASSCRWCGGWCRASTPRRRSWEQSCASSRHTPQTESEPGSTHQELNEWLRIKYQSRQHCSADSSIGRALDSHSRGQGSIPGFGS